VKPLLEIIPLSLFVREGDTGGGLVSNKIGCFERPTPFKYSFSSRPPALGNFPSSSSVIDTISLGCYTLVVGMGV